jgi:hypothetical protein
LWIIVFKVKIHTPDMKRKIILTLTFLMIVISCEGPETVVTNIVGHDGSVLRKAELKYTRDELTLNDFSVPVDSTWNLRDSMNVTDKGDTTWFLMAEKMFKSADEINETYLTDTGKNSKVQRIAIYQHSFKWFTSEWRFTEKCSKSFAHGYPAGKFMTPEEMDFRKLPSAIKEEKLAGPDSLKYTVLKDSLDSHTERWLFRSLISEWIADACLLCTASDKDTLFSDILRSHETDFDINTLSDQNFDSTCVAILGDSIFQKYKPELDSAISIADEKFDRSFSFTNYTMKTVMPSKVRSTNGYTMTGGEIAWPVNGDLFLTDDYVMWAESGEVNYWAIFLTAIILVTVPLEIRKHTRKRKDKI